MYNPRSPGVKRLMKEAKELAEPTEEYFACPLEDNIFEWHFTVRGPPSTEFEGGYYHGRILLPTQYPMQPPNIILLTPNGRFEINKKICLSISEHHPETWQPSWSIRTALLALIAFMPTAAAGTIGSLDYTPDERRVLAKRSLVWECAICGGRPAVRLLADVQPVSVITQEESALIKQIALKAEEDAARKTSTTSDVAREKSMGDMLTPEVGSSSDNVARQRLNSTASIATEASVQDSLLRASINSTNRDMLWSTIIWVLVLLISLLVIRRLFFLE